MKNKFILSFLLIPATIFFAPFLVYAHTGVGQTFGFWYGFVHPLGGIDHALAMIAVGIWASQIKGKAIWAVPATFVSVMVFGGILGISGIFVPFVELGIVMSVLMLGIFIATAARLPLILSVSIVGLFALFHGYAHGAEVLATSSGFTYSIGFAFATALLHLSGIGLGVMLKKTASGRLIRFAGATIVVAGIFLLLT